MDIIKIGKYIAGKRKSLGMTQKQLAEKLGMSDNSEVRNKYIEVIRDNINKQKCLKVMKCILLVISICAVSIIGLTIYRLKKPQNYISPIAKDSIEMQTAELLAGPDGAFIYKFVTTDEYNGNSYFRKRRRSRILWSISN